MTAVASPHVRRANPLVAVPEVLIVTFRQLLGRRRTILLAFLCAVPALLALLTVAAGQVTTRDFVEGIFIGLIVTALLPIVAVLVGTAAIGAEIEDGTIVYLLAKPMARWQIALAKLLGASIFCSIFAAGSTALAGVIALTGSSDGPAAIAGFVVASIVGAFCYCALFVVLSLFTRRAMVVAFGYVFLWEAAITTLMPGLANLSVRRYMLGVAEGFYNVGSVLKPETAWLLAILLVVIATLLSIWRLSRFQLPGSTD